MVVNWDGLIIGQGIATTQGDWMTTNLVPFTATISYTFIPNTPYTSGSLILKKDNPSGLSQNDALIEIPIVFGDHIQEISIPEPITELVDPMSPVSPPPSLPSEDNVIACTMDAKICPDGSAVGRTGPNCEFAPCP